MSNTCFASCFSASLIALHVSQFSVVRTLLMEHLTEQASVAGIIFDEQQQLDRFLPHSDYLCCGNFAFVSQ